MPATAVLTARFFLQEKAWNPKLHPRDARGRFIAKPRGIWEPNPLAALLDHKDPLTVAKLHKRLAAGDGHYADRKRWQSAINRFNKAADKGEKDPAWAFLQQTLAEAPDLDKYVDDVFGNFDRPNLRAAILRAVDAEKKKRASGAAGTMAGARRFQSNKDGDAWAKKSMPKPDLTPGERSAVQSYTGSGFSEVNGVLINGTAESAGTSTKNKIKNLDAAIGKSKVPEPLIVHRGSELRLLKELGGDPSNPATLQSMIGKVFSSTTFHSTSIGRQAAFSHKKVQWMIRLPTGAEALYVNHSGLSNYNQEREILLARDTPRVIHAIYRNPHDPNDQRWYVEVEVVPKGWQPPPDWTPKPVGDAWSGYLSKQKWQDVAGKQATDLAAAQLEARHDSEDEGIVAGAQADGPFPTVTGRPVRAAVLSDQSGPLGLVWTDGVDAAGWIPVPAAGPNVAEATHYVWLVLYAYAEDGGAGQVLAHPDVYGPAYQMGTPTAFASTAAAGDATLE